MYCKECGNKIEDSYNFCGICGCGLKETGASPAETDSQTRPTLFRIKNDVSGEEETVKVNKDTFENPILIGSGDGCDLVLQSTEDAVIFEQHALLGHMGHHTFLRTKRDANGKIPDAVNEYGHFAKYEDGDVRLTSRDDDEPGYYFKVGHYTIRMT